MGGGGAGKNESEGLKVQPLQKNQRYNSEGIYSYNTKIADLDFRFRSISKRGSYSMTSNKHYNYALRTLEICYDFYETSPAPPDAPREWLHSPPQCDRCNRVTALIRGGERDTFIQLCSSCHSQHTGNQVQNLSYDDHTWKLS